MVKVIQFPYKGQVGTLTGKIVVYPSCYGLGLVPLSELERRLPSVAAKLDAGQWCKAAEEELLATAAS